MKITYETLEARIVALEKRLNVTAISAAPRVEFEPGQVWQDPEDEEYMITLDGDRHVWLQDNGEVTNNDDMCDHIRDLIVLKNCKPQDLTL